MKSKLVNETFTIAELNEKWNQSCEKILILVNDNNKIKHDYQELLIVNQKKNEKLRAITVHFPNNSKEVISKNCNCLPKEDKQAIDKSILKIIFSEIENLYKEIIPVLFCENVYQTMKSKSIFIENKLNMIKSILKEYIDDIQPINSKTNCDNNFFWKSLNPEKNHDFILKRKPDNVKEKFISIDGPSDSYCRSNTNRDYMKKLYMYIDSGCNII